MAGVYWKYVKRFCNVDSSATSRDRLISTRCIQAFYIDHGGHGAMKSKPGWNPFVRVGLIDARSWELSMSEQS